jgi:hypothetical protein
MNNTSAVAMLIICALSINPGAALGAQVKSQGQQPALSTEFRGVAHEAFDAIDRVGEVCAAAALSGCSELLYGQLYNEAQRLVQKARRQARSQTEEASWKALARYLSATAECRATLGGQVAACMEREDSLRSAAARAVGLGEWKRLPHAAEK